MTFVEWIWAQRNDTPQPTLSSTEMLTVFQPRSIWGGLWGLYSPRWIQGQTALQSSPASARLTLCQRVYTSMKEGATQGSAGGVWSIDPRHHLRASSTGWESLWGWKLHCFLDLSWVWMWVSQSKTWFVVCFAKPGNKFIKNWPSINVTVNKCEPLLPSCGQTGSLHVHFSLSQMMSKTSTISQWMKPFIEKSFNNPIMWGIHAFADSLSSWGHHPKANTWQQLMSYDRPEVKLCRGSFGARYCLPIMIELFLKILPLIKILIVKLWFS